MARCINPKCGKEIDDAYYFCPACGTDNRPPEQRVALAKHRHQFLPFQEFCVWCGESNDEPYFFGRWTRMWLCKALAVAGVLLVGVGWWLCATGLGVTVAANRPPVSAPSEPGGRLPPFRAVAGPMAIMLGGMALVYVVVLRFKIRTPAEAWLKALGESNEDAGHWY